MAEQITPAKSDFYYNSMAMALVNKSVKHYHSLYEIYYLESGECNYLIEGKLFEMRSGDIVFIPKNTIHKTSYNDMYSRRLINCSGDYLKGVKIKTAFVWRNEKCRGEIDEIFRNIEKEYLHADRFSGGLIEGYMQQLLATVHRYKNRYENTRQQNKYVEETLEFLENNFTTEISLTAIAGRFGVSPEHLSRLFKKETGLNFNEYLSLLRLKKAEYILKSSDASVAEVAFSCGFNDSNYFCEKFKGVYGLPPLKFRKSFKP